MGEVRYVEVEVPASYSEYDKERVLRCFESAVGRPDTFHRVALWPAFHAEAMFMVEPNGEGIELTMCSFERSLYDYLTGDCLTDPAPPRVWVERVAVDDGPVWQRLDPAFDAFDASPQREAWGVDGISLTLTAAREGEVRSAEDWSPRRGSLTLECVHTVLRLAAMATESMDAAFRIGHVQRYLGGRFAVFVRPGDPHVIRLFGELLESHEDALRDALAGVPADRAAVIDASGLERIDPDLFECFDEFVAREAPTQWARPGPLTRYLEDRGVVLALRRNSLRTSLELVENESEWSPFDRLWLRLSQVRWDVPAEQSLMDRMMTPAWEHDDPRIRAAWRAITHPDNLAHLEERLATPLNPVAEEWTRRALEECRERAKRGGG